MENSKKPIILFLANTTHHTGAVADHINAVTACDDFEWIVENPLNCRVLHKLDLTQFDAIGLHYSIRPHQSYYFPKHLYSALAQYQGVKFLFMQDEYQDVDKAQKAIIELGFDVFFTLLREEYWAKGYPKLVNRKIKLVTVLTGYVPEKFKHKKQKTMAERTVDFFYRGREYEYWLGELTHEKNEIVEGVKERAQQYDLKTDVSLKEEDRLYGDKWFGALSSTRAVLATESGASVWDFDGAIKKAVISYVAKHKNAKFNEVYENVLKPVDGKIRYSAISPRIYEAIAVGTLLVMFPGYYDDIVKPDIHYIELKKDFSNFDDVVRKVKDIKYATQIVRQAYEDVIMSGKYSYYAQTQIIRQHLSVFSDQKYFQNKNEVRLKIDEIKKKYCVSNFIYNMLNEIIFALRNVKRVAFDPRLTLSERFSHLFGGGRRYVAYLIPRLFK